MVGQFLQCTADFIHAPCDVTERCLFGHAPNPAVSVSLLQQTQCNLQCVINDTLLYIGHNVILSHSAMCHALA